MYQSKNELKVDLKKAWPRLLTYKVVNKKYVLTNLSAMSGSSYFDELDTLADYGWTLYQRTYQNQLDLLLLGSRDTRKDDDLLRNFGTTSVTAIDESRGVFLGESIRYVKRRMEESGIGDMQGYDGMSATHGSILGEKRWVPVLNDIWLVAGCHRLSSFYVGALKDGTMWSKSQDRPRILGREILGLLACGYAMLDTPQSELTGTVFVPRDKDLAQGASLTRIGQAAASVTSLAALKMQIQASTIPRDSYLTWDVKPPSAADLKGKIVRVVEPIIGYDSSLNVGGPLRYTILPGRIRLTGNVARLSGMIPQDFIGVSILGSGARNPAVAMKSFHGHTTSQVSNPFEVMYVHASIIMSSPNVIVE